MMLKLDETNFKDTINGEKPSMVMFGASWCGPCKLATPQVEYLSNIYENFSIGKLDVEENTEIAKQYGIMKIPTILYFKNGEVVDKLNGSIRRTEMEAKLKAL